MMNKKFKKSKFAYFFLIVFVLISCSGKTNKKGYLQPPSQEEIGEIGTSIVEEQSKLEKLNIFYDYEKGLRFAKDVKKPILLMFTGYGVVNSRLLENQVILKDKIIYELMKNEFVNIWLYVDDRKRLPQKKMENDDSNIGAVKNLGEKWLKLELDKFQMNTQPLLVVLDNQEVMLGNPIGYVKSEKFKNFLLNGISGFKKLD